MDQARQFARLAADTAAPGHPTCRSAERDVQSHELLSAMNEFAERRQIMEDKVQALLERQSENDKALEERMIQISKEKKEMDEEIRREIKQLFREGAHGVQDILRRFGIVVPQANRPVNFEQIQHTIEEHSQPVPISRVSSPFSSFSDVSTSNFDDSFAFPSSELVEPEFVNLTPVDTPKLPSSSLLPSPPPNIPETKPEPQEWDLFFDYEEGVVWGSEGKPSIKPPTSFAEFCESDVATPADPSPCESVDDNVTISIPEWALNSIREIKVNGVSVLKSGRLELSVTEFDDRTVRFIDSGFYETVNLGNIRPLPTLFRHLPQQALNACLSFVDLIGPPTQHYNEALEALQKACAGRKFVAKLDSYGQRRANVDDQWSGPHLRLVNPGDNPENLSASIGVQLLRGGFACIDSQGYWYSKADWTTKHLLAMADMSARNKGVGVYRREEAAREPKEEVS
ncbi:hypothetical protein EWM64_g8511 [Hericium alpestre]|uniref:Tudor domain-containing protein n=1 Tax=Hericium alpestre TaxID=135208 RepID=A0A4Y9ZNT3_9AGAM|nr:hypothetical protein EWM64_g8511 [Hericium alpestre]